MSRILVLVVLLFAFALVTVGCTTNDATTRQGNLPPTVGPASLPAQYEFAGDSAVDTSAIAREIQADYNRISNPPDRWSGILLDVVVGVDVGATGETEAVAVGEGPISGRGGAVGVVDGLGMLFATGPHPTQMASNAIAVMIPFLILPLLPLSNDGTSAVPI